MFNKNKPSISRIAVFLGNPGFRYAYSKHNAGFMTADALSKKLNIKIDRLKHKSLTCVTKIGGESVLLMKPQTYMNLSGDAVSDAMRYYKVTLENVVVIVDDTALPLGKIRVRRNGSAGGHNGLRDIIAKCGGEGFTRVRIGVGEKPNPEMDLADWVLAPFTGPELDKIAEAADRAADCVVSLICDGTDAAMQKYN